VAEAGTNTIVIVNDNDMSIAENYGGLYKNLKELRDTEGKAENNFFKAMGLEYVYVKDGHNYKELINILSSVKDTEKPVVVHIHTVKGKGYEPAEKNKEMFHWGMPFEIETGKSKISMGTNPTYENLTAEFLLNAMKKDPTVVAMPLLLERLLSLDLVLTEEKKQGNSLWMLE